jgi:hypothetical protein
MTNSYYIFVHDLEIINLLEQRGEFKHLINYQYVLLTKREFNTNQDNIIVSKNYKLNIEDYKNYLQFTGWYCLGANKIPKTDYITLLEYDVRVSDDLDTKINTTINDTKLDCYGYACLPKTNSFLNNDVFSNGLIDYLRAQNILAQDIINSNHNSQWIVTSNVTIKTDVFLKLVRSNLFINLLNYLSNTKMSGHFLERFITAFLILNKYSYGFIENCVTHYAVDSHDTQNRNFVYQKFKQEQLTDLL